MLKLMERQLVSGVKVIQEVKHTDAPRIWVCSANNIYQLILSVLGHLTSFAGT